MIAMLLSGEREGGWEEGQGERGKEEEEEEQEGGRKSEGEGGREGGSKVGWARSIQSLHHVNISDWVNKHFKLQIEHHHSPPFASLLECLTYCAEVPEDGTAMRCNLQVGGEGTQGHQHILDTPFSPQDFYGCHFGRLDERR